MSRLDGVDVFLALAQRIGVVVAQVGPAVELPRDAEVQTDGLGVADVQVAVRLRREPRDDGLAGSRAQIVADALADEVPKILGHGSQRWCTSAHCTGSPIRRIAGSVRDRRHTGAPHGRC